MTIVGDQGALELQRQAAAPRVLYVADLTIGVNRVLLTDRAYMTGDNVTLSVSSGTLPLVGAGSGSGTYWINRDNLDRIGFYPTALDAINANLAAQIAFTGSGWTMINISQTAPPALFVADVLSWKLDLDAAVIDTTPIGVVFGQNIKDLVTGAGSLAYHVERRTSNAMMNAMDTLQLLMLTGQGAKVHAKLYLMRSRPGDILSMYLPGSLYYEIDLLVVASSVECNPEDLIKGAVNFATTDDIALRITT